MSVCIELDILRIEIAVGADSVIFYHFTAFGTQNVSNMVVVAVDGPFDFVGIEEIADTVSKTADFIRINHKYTHLIMFGLRGISEIRRTHRQTVIKFT